MLSVVASESWGRPCFLRLAELHSKLGVHISNVIIVCFISSLLCVHAAHYYHSVPFSVTIYHIYIPFLLILLVSISQKSYFWLNHACNIGTLDILEVRNKNIEIKDLVVLIHKAVNWFVKVWWLVVFCPYFDCPPMTQAEIVELNWIVEGFPKGDLISFRLF